MTVPSARANPRRPLRSWSAAVLGALALTLALAPVALADSTQSSNWAGYAVHGSHVSYRRVFGAWRQPTATCTHGLPTYSSVWVGLGGFSTTSPALEQIGSEVDCSASGRLVSSVWYELVPSPSRSVAMAVHPGDYLTAAVTATGHNVRLVIADVTRHTSLHRAVHVSALDVSSAEWIVEAPSVCSSGSVCQPLALADFGAAQFSRANVAIHGGYRGAIANRRWTTTKIKLAPSGRRFIASSASLAGASPSALTAGGSAFTVTYAGSSSTAASASAAPRTPTASRLVRPHRGS